MDKFEGKLLQYTCLSKDHDCVAVSSGTAGLHIALEALGIGPGDEVIVPSFSFFSSASSIVMSGATPVFADISDDAFALTPKTIKNKITGRTKAVMLVHYGGRITEQVEEIVRLCKKHDLFLIEDACQALGTERNQRAAGSFGDIGVFSFTPQKHITTGEGGAVVCKTKELADKLRQLRNHGKDENGTHTIMGYNYRMGEVAAAIGIIQLDNLYTAISQKQFTASNMTSLVRPMQGPLCKSGILQIPSALNNSMTLYTVILEGEEPEKNRAEIRRLLWEEGIETKIYFRPIHLEPVFNSKVSLPVTEDLFKRILTLPCHLGVGMIDREYIRKIFRKVLEP